MTVKCSNLLFDLLNVFELLILGVVFGEYVRVLLLKFIQRLTARIGGNSFISSDGAQFLYLPSVFLLSLDGFLLLFFIVLLGLFHALGLGLHREKSNAYTGKQCGDKNVWIGHHGSVEHLLRLLDKEQPVVMQRLCRSSPSFHGDHCHYCSTIDSVCGNESEQDTPETFVMLDDIGHAGEGLVDDTF